MLVTTSIALTAAYFSIVGLAAIFVGVHTPVLIMGGVLEAGKLTAASYLYRYWKPTGVLLRTYMLAAVLGLMLMTSAGIFGQLSKGYQTDTVSLKVMQAQETLLTTEQTQLTARKVEIDKQIDQLQSNNVRGRQKLMVTFAPELDKINARIPEITKQLQDLSSTQINQEAHVGPIIYIAKAFHTEVDDATKWLVLLIVFAFDPLAVSLTIATNIAIRVHKEEKEDIDPTAGGLIPQYMETPTLDEHIASKWPERPTPETTIILNKDGTITQDRVDDYGASDPVGSKVEKLPLPEPLEVPVEETIAGMDEEQIDHLISQAMDSPANEKTHVIPEIVSRLQKAVNIIDAMTTPTLEQIKTREKIKNILRKPLK